MSEEYEIQDGYYYTTEHEWAKVQEDGNVLIGITDYAQKQLHEIVYVELPEEGSDTDFMEIIGAVESVKAVSDMNSPVSGEVIEINDALEDSPELLNESPYVEGWMAKISPADLDGDLAKLMDSEAYKKYVAEQPH